LKSNNLHRRQTRRSLAHTFTICGLIALIEAPSYAQVSLSTLHSFASTNFEMPRGNLIEGPDGTIYGTAAGGPQASGMVFKITNGIYSTFIVFDPRIAANPQFGLTLGTDGNFYGTTPPNGGIDGGDVYKLTPAGQMTLVYRFVVTQHSNDTQHGWQPACSLVDGGDGYLYGTTEAGGEGIDGRGTVFKVTPAGDLVTLHTFQNPSAGGEVPIAGLTIRGWSRSTPSMRRRAAR